MGLLSSWCEKTYSSNTATSSRRNGGRSVTAADNHRCCLSGCANMWRFVRKLKKQSKMLCITSRPATPNAFDFQYDPVSYARNFDHNGVDDDATHFLYTFSSRFVAVAKSPLVQGDITR